MDWGIAISGGALIVSIVSSAYVIGWKLGSIENYMKIQKEREKNRSANHDTTTRLKEQVGGLEKVGHSMLPECVKCFADMAKSIGEVSGKIDTLIRMRRGE